MKAVIWLRVMLEAQTPDRGELAREESRAEVLRGDDPRIGRRDEEHPHRGRERAGENDQHERPASEELADDELRLAQRLCEEPVERPETPFLGQASHRDRRDQHGEEDREEVEERSQARESHRVHVPEREVERYAQKGDGQHVRRRVVDEASQFALRHGYDGSGHAAASSSATPSPLSWVRSWNTCSRLTRSRWSSQSVHPLSLASEKIVGRSSFSPDTSSETRTRPSTASGAVPEHPVQVRKRRRHLASLSLYLDDVLGGAGPSGQEILHAPVRSEPAPIQDEQTGTGGLDLLHDVCAEKDRPFAPEVHNQASDVDPLVGVEPLGRLIEHEDLGPVQDRGRQPDTLPEPLRELPDRAEEDVLDARLLDGLGDPGARFGPGKAV